MKAIDRDCKNCVKRKTIYCPNSKLCYDILYLPYFQDRVMLLKENETLKKQVEELQEEYESFQEEENSIQIELKDDRDNYYERLQDKYREQKKFIKYLEDEKDRLIKGTSHYYIDSFDRQHAVNETIYDEVDVILQKYKKIIGVSNENN